MIANKELDNIFSLLRSYYSVKRRLWRGIETVTFLENVYRAEGGRQWCCTTEINLTLAADTHPVLRPIGVLQLV